MPKKYEIIMWNDDLHESPIPSVVKAVNKGYIYYYATSLHNLLPNYHICLFAKTNLECEHNMWSIIDEATKYYITDDMIIDEELTYGIR